jgi:enterochelin esterase-like enzyme
MSTMSAIIRFFSVTVLVFSLQSCAQDAGKDNDPGIPETFSELLMLIEDVEMENRAEFVNSFLESVPGFPIIENDMDVYFLYDSEATGVQVAGDFSGWSPSGRNFTLIQGTNIWYRKETFESNARLDYKLVINGSNWILDPKNPNRISGGFGANSELAMPAYEQPMEIVENAGTPKGTISTISLPSVQTGKTYSIKIYLPPNYDTNNDYPVAYFQDGGEYISLASSTTIIDNLIASNDITPIIGVFVIPTNRNVEYAGGDRTKYTNFFVSELVPYIDSNYSTIANKSSRAVIGDSYGGNISAIISFSNPTVFGNCGLHSGAFQPNNYETNGIVMDGTNHGIKVVSIWGTYESLYTNMRAVRDYLIEKEYEIIWKELPEGHSWGLWRATIDDMLISFFPKEN